MQIPVNVILKSIKILHSFIFQIKIYTCITFIISTIPSVFRTDVKK